MFLFSLKACGHPSQGKARQNRRHNEAQSSDSRQPTSIYESRFYMLFGMSETGGDAGVSNV